MHYLISGKLIRSETMLRMPHAEFVELVQTKVVPALASLIQQNAHGKVLAGGLPAGSRDIVLIVDLMGKSSHRCVRSFLLSLPIFDYYEWDAVPLETFEELIQSVGD